LVSDGRALESLRKMVRRRNVSPARCRGPQTTMGLQCRWFPAMQVALVQEARSLALE
jgi:hypothetical protein